MPCLVRISKEHGLNYYTDPYIRIYFINCAILMELLETTVKYKSLDEEVFVHLVTIEDEFKK